MSLPGFLYRAFQDENQALEFVKQGRFRLGLLRYYTEIEDNSRRDKTEGTSEVRIPGNDILGLCESSFSATWMNPLYVLCCFGPDVDLNHAYKTFGKYVVKIKAPSCLLDDLNCNSPIGSRMKLVDKFELQKVEYTKGQRQQIDVESIEACRMSYYQKPSEYSKDHEWRYVVRAVHEELGFNEPEKFIQYDLCRSLNYLELVQK
jgi:hypothetical protein